MEGHGSRYRRLQVDRIWARTFFEIAAIITAIVICSSIVVSGYEKSYAAYSSDYTTDNARQLARSVSLIANRDTLEIADPARSQYAAEQYSKLLDDCFLSGDNTYSGAIYRVFSGQSILFAESSRYIPALRGAGLASRDGTLAYGVQQYLDAAAAGRASYQSFGDTYMAFEPVFEEGSDVPYAVVVTQVMYQNSVTRDGDVRKRLIQISTVCGGLILIYYCISAARSKSKTRKGETVN